MAQARRSYLKVVGAATARVSIRPHYYRHQSGFLLYGTDTHGRKVSIFAVTRSAAEHIRDLIRADREITSADFQA